MSNQTTNIQYPLNNDLMFGLVMQNQVLCKDLLERILPGRKIQELKVCDASNTNLQKTIITGIISKCVRLDVLFTDNPDWYNLEMSLTHISLCVAVTMGQLWILIRLIKVVTIIN